MVLVTPSYNGLQLGGSMDTKELESKLREIKPRFKLVSPLAAKIMLIFGWGNVALGSSLFFEFTNFTNLAIINSLTDYQWWGLFFVALGVLMLVSYWRNSWTMMKRSLLIGIILKGFWLIAIIARLATGEQTTPTLLIIWSILFFLQVATYIDFMPSPKQNKK